MQAAAEAAKQAITAVGGALITGLEFGIGAIGPGMASGFAGGEGSFLDVLKGGAIGFGTGFITGAAVGYSYAKGWQSFLHGADIRATNAQILMKQVGNGDYVGASATLRTDSVLARKLANPKVHFTTNDGVNGILSDQVIRKSKDGFTYLADLMPGVDSPEFTSRSLQLSSVNKGDYFIGIDAKNLVLAERLKITPYVQRMEYRNLGNINLKSVKVYGSYSNTPT